MKEYITEELANKAYLEYLENHINNAYKALIILENLNINFINENKDILEKLVKEHDKIKYTIDEYPIYRRHFFKVKGEVKIPNEFNIAVTHHYKNNKHHWQYWISNNELIPNIDEYEYKLHTIERIVDWMSSSKYENDSVLNYWNKHKDKMIMPKYAFEMIDDILNKLPIDYLDYFDNIK